MLKVLIVDDEPFIREGLKKLIDWNNLGFEICAEAEDGKDAFVLIQRFRPDLVITDIRMIEMSGLELIKIVREDNSFDNIRFIILSAYGEFEYAKQALKYKIKDYILKPINYVDVTRIIREVYMEIIKEIDEKMGHDRFMKSNLIQVIHGKANESLIDNIENSIGINKKSDLRCSILHANVFDNNQIVSYLTQKNIFSIVEEKNSINIILSDRNCKISAAESVELFLEGIIKELAKTFGGNFFVFCGKRVTGINNIRESYDTAKYINKYRYYNENLDVIIFENIVNVHFSPTKGTDQYFDGLLKYIEIGNYQIMQLEIEKLFVCFHSQLVDPEYIQTLLFSFQLKLLSNIEKNNIEEKIYEKEDISISLINAIKYEDTFDSIKTKFIVFCTIISHLYKDFLDNNSWDLVENVKKYVNVNYKNEVSIKDIAKMFYVNPVYLGQVFKKSQGIYFNNYLNSLRLEEAKELLKTTNLKIYEVANKAGYSNDVYFINKFVSIEGLSPSDYRKKFIKNKI